LFFIFCAASGTAQSVTSQQQETSPPALPKIQVPVYRLHSHPQMTLLKPDSPEIAGAVAGSQRCYTLRQYQFEQVDPKSDVTRFKGYAACQAPGRIRLKGATVNPSR